LIRTLAAAGIEPEELRERWIEIGRILFDLTTDS
jgi:hypothetical protein